jgi:DNA polymerase IV (archaeal DinB-like DNA polymerase)
MEAGQASIILHLDMDAFYAAVETARRPDLAGRPVVIGADPQGGRGRGVAATANYEARRFGIHSAMPISQAYEACPQAVFLRPDFPAYKAASRQVMQVLAGYADTLEQVGLDEAYLDITQRIEGDWERARAFCLSLQAAVRRHTGLSCSIGAGPSKSVAKMASDAHKPHGITVVSAAEVRAFMAPLPVRRLHGCGPKTTQRLHEWDIYTVADLAAQDPRWLESRLGAHGLWLHQVANGRDDRPVQAERGPAKSRSNERTFLRDERHPAFLMTTAGRLLEELLNDADSRPFATLTVKVRYGDYATLTRSQTLPLAIDPRDPDAVKRSRNLMALLLEPLLDGRPVRLLGIRLSGFTAEHGQRPLSRYGITYAPTTRRRPARPSARRTAQETLAPHRPAPWQAP